MTMHNRYFIVMLLLLLGPAGRAASEEAGRHLFILSGQSNMTRPVVDSFRHCVEQVFGGDKVIVVRSARPSQPIKQWYRDWQPPAGLTDENPEQNGTLYDEMMAAVARNVKQNKIATVTFIWMQGEADAREWGSVYEKSFLGLVEQIRQDLGVERVNFVLGRINEFWLINKDKFPDAKLVRSAQVKLGEEHANGDWVNTDDLNRGVNPWGGYSFEDGHFPPPGYTVMGQRFAKKACLLLDPAIELDPQLFKEHFIDSADQIKTHGAVGRAVSGPEPTKGAVLSALTDGKYAAADHAEPGWVVFAPSDQPIELVVDLGAVQAIESVAVNKLLSSAAKSEFPDKFVFTTSEDGKAYKLHQARYHTVTPYYGRKHLERPDGKGFGPESVLLLTTFNKDRAGRPVQARYVKIQVHTGDHWALLDEIVVNPVKDFTVRPAVEVGE